MNKKLSYVLVTPYAIQKSRTGGILARLFSRTDLELAGAQIFAPDAAFTNTYSEALRQRTAANQPPILADYVKQHFSPSDGKPHRALLLVFRGDNPCDQLHNICGHFNTQKVEIDALCGETIRDTYSDLIYSDDNPNEVRYFEPAVLTPRNQEEADSDLRLFAGFLEGKENLVQNVTYPDPSKIERTLVIIKPDNWVYNSLRPGAIIDIFSRTGLRIIGLKAHRFSLAQALEFYGPVEEILCKKLSPRYGKKAKELLEKECGFTLSETLADTLTKTYGVDCAVDQFHQIVEFMSGKRPCGQSKEEMEKLGEIKCMILVYEGENAVAKIRDVLGPTNPLEAPDGTVRREFGLNVMVNTAHASDSAESYEREQGIVQVNKNMTCAIIKEYLGG
ncbi:MAG: nucleoside-diphosphate kinase [Treponema sp.]|nr:nucleoside-diphosphate kinase [Treponema sp.]